MSKHRSEDFKWRHYQGEIIMLCVRWYLRYRLSYRDLEEMMAERGLVLDHTTIYRWVQHYGKEIHRRMTKYMQSPNDSWRIDETYVKIKGVWRYLYRAVDSDGKTIDFYLSKTRDRKAAKKFLKNMHELERTSEPRVMNVDLNPAYPAAFSELQSSGLFKETDLRKCKYLNNIIEQDHRRVKWKNRHAMGYASFETAKQTMRGIDAMHMIFKRQIKGVGKGITAIKSFIESLFALSIPAH